LPYPFKSVIKFDYLFYRHNTIIALIRQQEKYFQSEDLYKRLKIIYLQQHFFAYSIIINIYIDLSWFNVRLVIIDYMMMKHGSYYQEYIGRSLVNFERQADARFILKSNVVGFKEGSNVYQS